MSVSEESKYILGVDFGSTSLVAKIYDQHAKQLTATSVNVPYIHPEPDAVEIDPNALWELFVDVVKATFTKSEISSSDIKAFGFCCQRSTMMLWDKNTGEPCCNLISWQDIRCANTVDTYNKAWMLKSINICGNILYTFLRQIKFLVMKILKFHIGSAVMKLIWFLDSNPEIKEAVNEGRIYFGTLDSWIIWKLTKGRLHLTEPTNAVATGMYDPYLMEWSKVMPWIFNVPTDILPPCCDTSGHICDVDEEIFGASFPLNAFVGDAIASGFGQCCFEPGQAACTVGTGCFFTINTGRYAHASIKGLYPQIGWSIGEEVCYVCEGQLSGIAASIEWARTIGLYEDVSTTADIARTVEDTNGVYFVPAFYGLSAPYQDPTACASFIGIKTNTSKAHMLRAVLEGIAFQIHELYQITIEETKMPFHSTVRMCGGVTNNDLIMELISSLTGCTLIKSLEPDMSLLGAVYLAGMGAGIWKSREEIASLEQPTMTFDPNEDTKEKYTPIYEEWKKAVERSLKWYEK